MPGDADAAPLGGKNPTANDGGGTDIRRLSRNGDTLYELLEIPKTSTHDEIRRKYRRLALKYHPDKNPNNPEAEEKFKSINRAHTILSDEKKRELYDKYGSFGLYLSDQVGDEAVDLLMMMSSKWFQCLFWSCCLVTGCYFCCCGFCCCCCFCCGKCKPEGQDADVPDVAEFEGDEDGDNGGDGGVVTQQPGGSSQQQSEECQKNSSGQSPSRTAADASPPPAYSAVDERREGDVVPDENTALNSGDKVGYTPDMTSSSPLKRVPQT